MSTTDDAAADDSDIEIKPSTKKIKTSHTPNTYKKNSADIYRSAVFNFPLINPIDAAKTITEITTTAMNCTDENLKEKLIKTTDFIMEKAVSLSSVFNNTPLKPL